MGRDETATLGQLADDSGVVDQHGDVTESQFARLLGHLPNLLSSRPVIVFGIVLFCYLFVFAGVATLLGHPTAVSANTQLILGNYTNVSSSVGAGIAAGASLTLVKRQRRAHKVAQAAHAVALEARAFAMETHKLMHLIHPAEAARLGHLPGQLSTGDGRDDATGADVTSH